MLACKQQSVKPYQVCETVTPPASDACGSAPLVSCSGWQTLRFCPNLAPSGARSRARSLHFFSGLADASLLPEPRALRRSVAGALASPPACKRCLRQTDDARFANPKKINRFMFSAFYCFASNIPVCEAPSSVSSALFV